MKEPAVASEEAVPCSSPADEATPPASASPFGPKTPPGRDELLIGLGWLGTGLALSVGELPFKYLLKDQLHLTAEALAGFTAISHIPIYIKPFAGILSDAVPLFGTRRRHYLLFGLLLTGMTWIALALVPRQFNALLATAFILSIFQTVVSTVLGGLMVEVGKVRNSTGRLSAQRLGITRIVTIVSGPLSGVLSRLPYLLTASICAVLQLILVPLFWKHLREPRSVKRNDEALREIGQQFRTLVRSRILWAAAGMIILVVAAPGFTTPLFYYQTDKLKFTPEFIGSLGVVMALGGMSGAVLYGFLCRRFNLRALLAISIVVHAALTLLYLFYKDPTSALIISGIEAATMSLALLPLYDLAARGTPRGSEALGYSVMMSVWNFTIQMSDLLGSTLYTRFGLQFHQLVWVNAAMTILVLVAVPFLPKALVDRKDGEGG